MRKMILLAAMVAIAALMMAAAPAMADDNDGDGRDDVTFRLLGDDFCDWYDCHDDDKDFCDWYDCNNDDDDFCRFFDCRDDHNDEDFCHFFDCRDDNNNNNNNFVPAVTQDFEQEAESGDVDQSFDVSQTGDNSNQTVGIQGVANTGNAQNQIGVIDAGGFGDFEFEDVGSTIEVSPTNTVTSDQEVNQAAAAFGHKGWW